MNNWGKKGVWRTHKVPHTYNSSFWPTKWTHLAVSRISEPITDLFCHFLAGVNILRNHGELFHVCFSIKSSLPWISVWFSNLLKVILELKFQKCGLEIRELKISFQDWGFTQHIHCSYIVEGNIAISLKNDLPKNGPTLPYTIKIGKLFSVEKMGNFEKYSPLLFGSRHWPTIWILGPTIYWPRN